MNRCSMVLAALLFTAGLYPVSVEANEGPSAAKGAEHSVAGHWLGTLKISGISLRLAVSVTSKADGSYSATLTSIDQDNAPHPFDAATINGDSLHLEMKQMRLIIDGKLNEARTELAGKFKQGPLTAPIVFKKSDHAPEKPKRPQEPKPPFPYRSEEVTYENKAGHAKLAGTLTIPTGKGPHPAVLLITGSGQQNRNEEILGHRPFWVLADYLTRRGIAVLRVDDRGVGGSTGDVAQATSEDFAGDVLTGVAYLKTRPEIDSRRIGLMGHSEGGEIAPMVANRSNDIAFIVLLAGPGVPGEQIVLSQMEFLLKEAGASKDLIARTRAFQQRLYAAVKEEHDAAVLKKKMKTLYEEYAASLSAAEKGQAGARGGEQAEASAKVLGSPWFRYFLAYDPRPALKQVKCPVLALIGEKDMQVPPKMNIPELEKALREGGNKDFNVRQLPHLNHLFQTCDTGSVAEYAKIEETFNASALELIAKWIQEHTSGAATAHAAQHP